MKTLTTTVKDKKFVLKIHNKHKWTTELYIEKKDIRDHTYYVPYHDLEESISLYAIHMLLTGYVGMNTGCSRTPSQHGQIKIGVYKQDQFGNTFLDYKGSVYVNNQDYTSPADYFVKDIFTTRIFTNPVEVEYSSIYAKVLDWFGYYGRLEVK